MRALAFVLVLFAAVAAAVAAPDDRPVVIQLGDGTRLVGRVVEDECTDELLVIRELRGGAKRRIAWGDLKPAQASELRVALGFEIPEAAAGALKLDGHEIRNRAGVTFEGLLLNPDTAPKDGFFRLKTNEGELKIRLADVVDGPTPIRLDALRVYTPLELYERRLAETRPETAEDHYLLAEYCVAIGALDQAKEHYNRTLELKDPKYTEDKIQRSLTRIEKLLANRDARDALDRIRRDMHYNRFGEAARGLAAFREQYAEDADLLDEAAKLEEQLTEEQDDYFIQRIPRRLRDLVKDRIMDRIKENAKNEEWSIREAMKFAGGEAASEDSVSHLVLLELAEELAITPEETLDYWNRRPKHVMNKAFYRDGTFIVVDNLEDALSKAPKVKPPKGVKASQLPKPRKQMTPEEWFQGKLKARRHTELRDWMYAFWAERSGMTEVLEPKEEICPTCAGKGYVQGMIQTGTGALPFFDRCGTCHMAKQLRVVRFR